MRNSIMKNSTRLKKVFFFLAIFSTALVPSLSLADSFQLFKVSQNDGNGYLVNSTRRSYQWVAPACILQKNLSPTVFPTKNYLDSFSKWNVLGSNGTTLDKWRSCSEIVSALQAPTLGTKSKAHLLIFTNKNNVKTPYFVYNNKKQYISRTCRVNVPRINPFTRYPTLDVKNTSEWNSGANIPPLGGPSRTAEEKLTCNQMANIADRTRPPKLIKYRKSGEVHTYFVHAGTKQWIKRSGGSGISCYPTLARIMRNSYLPTVSTWKMLTNIAGPDAKQKLGCKSLLELARLNRSLAITLEAPSDPPTTTSSSTTTSSTSTSSTSTSSTSTSSTSTITNTTLPPSSGTGIVDRNSPVGVNINPEIYWTPSWSFVNVMNKANAWNANSGSLNLDNNGWVKSLESGQTASSSVYQGEGLAGLYPTGRYTVLYDGEGTILYGGSTRLVSSSPGKDIVEVGADYGIRLTISKTNSSNYIRNIRVILPGGSCQEDKTVHCKSNSQCANLGRCVPFTESYSSRMFHPNFIKNLKGFPVLRFMEWMSTNYGIDKNKWVDPLQNPNNFSARTWAKRIKPKTFPWAESYHVGREIPYEVMTSLANEIGADAWITLSHLVNDDYVRNLARFMKANLNSERKVYLELSNELWNTGFAQGKSLSEKRGNIGALEAGMDRSVEIFKIFTEEFGGNSRLVRIYSLQAHNYGYGRRMMKRAQSNGSLKFMDAISIAPYFGGQLGCQRAKDFYQMSVAELIQDLMGSGMNRAILAMQEYGKIAKEFGVDLLAYEGGQHVALYGPKVAASSLCNDARVHNNDPAMVEKSLELSRHPGMKAVYLRYLNEWRKAGGKHFSLFNYTGKWSKWGHWSFFENNYDGVEKDSPKFQGVEQFRLNNRKWW